MVVTKRVIVGAVVACAVGGTGFLFAQSRSIDVETHGAVVRALGELDQRAAELSKEGLATRFGLVPNYDPLVGTVTTLEEDVAALDRALVRSDTRTDAVVAAEAGLRAALDARRATVERLKREVAVLKNSLRYLPLAAEMLLRDTREAGDAEGGADAVNAVVAATLVYDLLGETRLLEAQKARVAALAAMRDAFPEDVREDLDLLIHHATRAASHHAVVGPLVDAMMGTELEAAVEGVRGAYDAAFADGVATATRWRTVLYVWCALLLVVVGVTLRKLRELFASLERKVAERTAALHAR
ncbi:MAG: hypothetical protein KC635_27180, partial [Myxococcales bacterium]|nr:hypothetical protein [Myxococcales bacterium]